VECQQLWNCDRLEYQLSRFERYRICIAKRYTGQRTAKSHRFEKINPFLMSEQLIG